MVNQRENKSQYLQWLVLGIRLRKESYPETCWLWNWFPVDTKYAVMIHMYYIFVLYSIRKWFTKKPHLSFSSLLQQPSTSQGTENYNYSLFIWRIWIKTIFKKKLFTRESVLFCSKNTRENMGKLKKQYQHKAGENEPWISI